MINMSINITNHALDRYSKRIKNDDIVNITSLDSNTRERYEKDILNMYENSKLIYEGKFTDHSDSKFLLTDDIILITDPKETKLITLYRIDFGFDYETNKILRNRLLVQLEKAKNTVSDSELKVNEALTKATESLDVLIAERNDLQASLKAVNDSIDITKDYIESLNFTINENKSRYNNIARQICYSINCKKAFEIK